MKAPRTDRLQRGFTKYFHPDFYGTWEQYVWGTCALKVAAARFGVYSKWGFRKIRGTFLGVPIRKIIAFGDYIGVPLF